MAQSILELAKQGDPVAIAALINRSLEPRGIKAQTSLENDCLQVVLQSSQVLNQNAVVSLIQRGMMTLQVKSIKKVNIYARKLGSNFVGWQTELNLDINSQSSMGMLPRTESTESANSLSIDQPLSSESFPVAKSNQPQGIILMQKLAQLKNVSQEYQDIIIRFIDDTYGTVKCLSTLTELVQAINKSSFSFSAVAANASLRSLLDTIAEFTTTDENGDQVINNVSILQPGQQWQKVKIRLVTKIFFEPESYIPPQSEPTEPERVEEIITLDVMENLEDKSPDSLTPAITFLQEFATSTPQPEPDFPKQTQEEVIEESTEDLFAEFISSASESNYAAREPQSALADPVSRQSSIETLKPPMLDELASLLGDALDDDEPTEILPSQSQKLSELEEDFSTSTFEDLSALINSVRSPANNSANNEEESNAMTLENFSLDSLDIWELA